MPVSKRLWILQMHSYTNGNGKTEYVFYNAANAAVSFGQDKTVAVDSIHTGEHAVIFEMSDGSYYIEKR